MRVDGLALSSPEQGKDFSWKTEHSSRAEGNRFLLAAIPKNIETL